MPGLGPHAGGSGQGRGFWANQPGYYLQQVTTTVYEFRPPLKGLPEQPWRPDFTWAQWYNLNLIGRDRLPAGEQVFDLAPAQRPPEQIQLHSWQWSYNLSLIGRDKLPVGENIYERPTPPPPAALFWTYNLLENTLAVTAAPFFQTDWPLTPAPLRIDETWSYSYNLNLIAQDAMIVGDQRYDLAPIWPPYINQLRTWSWSYNLALIGRDRLPTGAQRYDLTVHRAAPQPIEQTWVWRYNLNLIGKDQLPPGEDIFDLAPSQRPPEQVQLHSWQWSYNLNLVGQDRMLVGDQFTERPQLPPVPPALTWIEGPQYELIARPFAQYDWPNAIPNYRVEQTWATTYNLNLIGQDKMVTGQQSTDLPPRDYLRLFQTWISSVNAALVVTPPVETQTLFKQITDLTPRGAEPDPRRSWEWQYNKNLIGQDQLPFRQQDWQVQVTPAQVQSWIDQTKIQLISQNPFSQTNWPNPTAPQQPTQSWTSWYNLNLVGQDKLPFRQTDWPLTTTARPGREPTLDSWTGRYNLNLIGKDQLPNRQQDWPISSAHILPQLQIMVAGKPFFLIPPVAGPLGVVANQYDWPLPQRRTDQPADQFFTGARYPVIPPPPVTGIIPLRTLMGTGV